MMDVIAHLFPESRLGRAVTRGMRVVLASCMLGCVTAALEMQLTVLLPERMFGFPNFALPVDPDGHLPLLSWILSPSAIAHATFSVWTYVQLVSYFFAACSTPPSRIRTKAVDVTAVAAAAGDATTAAVGSAGARVVVPLHALSSSALQAAARGSSGASTMCRRCLTPKLLRTHHCRICNTCVELMDHRQTQPQQPTNCSPQSAAAAGKRRCARSWAHC